MLATSLLVISDNPEKFSAYDSKKRHQAKIHPNAKFIITLATDEKKKFSNLFIFIIFPLFLKCRFIVIMFTELLYLIYTYHIIDQYTTAVNSHNIISKLYQALISD